MHTIFALHPFILLYFIRANNISQARVRAQARSYNNNSNDDYNKMNI